jgi:hypothetical protein
MKFRISFVHITMSTMYEFRENMRHEGRTFFYGRKLN